jgi:ubiquinone/menaquinone biosynthesis C-methylase UbiE
VAPDPATVYDELAPEYAEGNPESAAREGTEWPAVEALLPPVDDRQVLDLACGTGHFAATLAARGAAVVGLDASTGMLAEARERHGDTVHVGQADLRGPLPIPDDTFDIVLVQLALDHVRDWDAVAGEIARVLLPGGSVVISVDHPFTTWFVIDQEPPEIGAAEATAANYDAVEAYTKRWGNTADGEAMPMYRRPLAEVTRPFLDAGLAITGLEEAQPTVEDALTYFKERTPRFLAIRARLLPD